jgi:hypothetical protein
MMDSLRPTTMDSLPNELLAQIAAHLAVDAPSTIKFAHEPSAQLTDSESAPLKALSRVSWRYRKIVLPVLFKYSRVELDPNPQWVPLDARLIENMQHQLTTLSTHEIMIYHRMRNKFKSGSMFAYDEAFDDLLINLCRIQDDDNFLKSAPSILWLPHISRSFADFERFVTRYALKHHIKSVVVHTDREYQLRHVSTANAPLVRAVSEIWAKLFSVLEPARVVVAAPPSTLAGLLDTQLVSADTWAFDMAIHYIELLQPEPFRFEHMESVCRPWNTALVHRRPWYHLGYNEGSSIAAYSTYEYHLKQSPKMLYLTLLRLAKEASPCCNITSFSFIGVFPFATNMTTLTRALHRIPSLMKLRFQLAPGPENDLFSSPARLGRAQPMDIWREWSESYKIIGSYLNAHDFAAGAEFASGDRDSAQLTRDVDEHLEARRRGPCRAGWERKEVSVWVRRDGEEGNDGEDRRESVFAGAEFEA